MYENDNESVLFLIRIVSGLFDKVCFVEIERKTKMKMFQWRQKTGEFWEKKSHSCEDWFFSEQLCLLLLKIRNVLTSLWKRRKCSDARSKSTGYLWAALPRGATSHTY